MDLQLSDKTAMVTGSSKGIGEAIAVALAREGASVIVHGRDSAQADRVVNAIIANGGRAYSVLGDLTQDEAVERLAAEAEERVGPVDILVNNAGGSSAKSDWQTTAADAWASTYDRNVLAAVRVSTRLLPAMRQSGWGRVINISSGAATMPPMGGPEYSAAKAAINAMTASMAKAVAAEGVTVNAVSPGTIKSAKLEDGFRNVAAARGIAAEDAPWGDIQRGVLPLFAAVPIGRVGELHELADAVAFLASPLAGYITGINLHVDGGFTSIP
jgi:NAD(P)-dependent dehydrogenase (short-subunit alcohol dehydrogenase family)